MTKAPNPARERPALGRLSPGTARDLCESSASAGDPDENPLAPSIVEHGPTGGLANVSTFPSGTGDGTGGVPVEVATHDSGGSPAPVAKTPRSIEDRPLAEFLGTLPNADPSVSEQTADWAKTHWRHLRQCFAGRVRMPVVFPTGGGAVQFAWRTDWGVLSVDIDESGALEWFCRRRSTGAFWDEESRVGEPMSDRVHAAFAALQGEPRDCGSSTP